MQVTISEVEKIAMMSRIRFNDQEKKMYQQYIESAVNMANQLVKLDTEGVEPTAHIQSFCNVLREDVIEPSMDNEQLMANAYEHENGCFIVPKVVE